MGKYAKKKKTGRILTVMLLVCCSLFVLGTSRAGTQNDFVFTEYEYENWHDNVSRFEYKETASSMYVRCDATSALFRVHALGSNDWGETSDYADCSGGYYYWLSTGTVRDNVYNFVYENGYECGGLQGYFGGDEYFQARGVFKTDN